MAERYEEHVKLIESTLGPHGFSSLSGRTIDGADAIGKLSDRFATSEGAASLRGRTPSTIDRDRVIHSDAYRTLENKRHVLFFGAARLARTYSSHATKCSQVARSAAARLELNVDLVEAISLGSKVGSVPFIHVGKTVVPNWIEEKLADATGQSIQANAQYDVKDALFTVGSEGEYSFPSWIDKIKSPETRRSVAACMPWAAVQDEAEAYHSGQQSYWSLTVDPFVVKPVTDSFLAQTMYGVWRHSLDSPNKPDSRFLHALQSRELTRKIGVEHATHEAVVVRYCDDIVWVLENLNEATRVATLGGRSRGGELPLSPFKGFLRTYGTSLPLEVRAALGVDDASGLYTYFIDDLVKESKKRLDGVNDGAVATEAIGLSENAADVLNNMKKHLDSAVFKTTRLELRKGTLTNILETALDILYRSQDSEALEWVRRYSLLNHGDDRGDYVEKAQVLLATPAHRVQVAVNILASMSDSDVFHLVGLE
ncbi:hypothetical protein IFU08_12395 [Microbacterium sp. CFBP 8790]|uniref:hypothetical protein n=1 Tax=unclassified Microbacterium TaxID=2609290 RepID=UPI00177C6FEC|nr:MULTISPECIES: hypothetical protein [unclassified Microbacterium]MBD8207789.1 hypothetical protein [Microbacterium sp. CFBP 8801]MBD8510357.1 hypothetical protein [Microbacterium sp. CFBP 8790]